MSTSEQRLTDLQKSVIANGAALGSAIRIGGSALVGIIMPAAWTLAALTFQVSPDEVNWHDVFLDDANTELTIPNTAAVASRAIAMNTVLDKLAVFNWIRPRSGTTGTPVNQGAERTLTFVMKA